MMLDYVDWFNGTICDDPTTFCNDFKLSLRDVLSWARFIADVSLTRQVIDNFSAYLHGASLMHLDGVGLGTGVSNHDASVTRDKAKTYLLQQTGLMEGSLNVIGFKDELRGIDESLIDTEDLFGIRPFTIPKGNNRIPVKSKFHMTAPTTGMNLRRVLRGMQISKPILLEGSPGVGKTR
jgi:midasin